MKYSDTDKQNYKNDWFSFIAKSSFSKSSITVYDESDKNISFKLGYKKFNNLVQETVKELSEQGIKKSQLIAIAGDNSLYTIKNIFALWQLEAVPLPVNSKLDTQELNKLLQFVKPNHIINSSDKLLLEKGIVSSHKHNLKNIALVMFTSGVSGKPKAVVHSFHSIQKSAQLGAKILNYSSKDKWLLTLPLYHIGGFSILTRTVIYGSSLIIPKSLKIDDIISAIYNEDPSLLSLVSSQLNEIVSIKMKANKSHRYLLVGGGPINDELIVEAISLGWNVCKVYGSTETASFITFLKKEEILKKQNCAGYPIPDVQIKIIKRGKEQLPFKNGEIYVSSPTLFQKYLFNEKLTSRKLKESYFKTGDIGYIDDYGFLYIESRKSDMIITGGENVNLHEIEKVLLTNSKIKECCVMGIQDKKWGEVIVAAVVLKRKAIIGSDELKQFLKNKIANFKIPKKYFFVSSLPKTSLGKLKREEVKSIIEYQLSHEVKHI